MCNAVLMDEMGKKIITKNSHTYKSLNLSKKKRFVIYITRVQKMQIRVSVSDIDWPQAKSRTINTRKRHFSSFHPELGNGFYTLGASKDVLKTWEVQFPTLVAGKNILTVIVRNNSRIFTHFLSKSLNWIVTPTKMQTNK